MILLSIENVFTLVLRSFFYKCSVWPNWSWFVLKSNATSGQTFSALRRAKMYLENTMKQVRLNNILMLHVYKDCTDAWSLINVVSDVIDGLE